MAAGIEWVLFDWGNVLVEYRPLGMTKLARELGAEPAALAQFASTTRLFKELTAGALSPETGIERLAQRFGVTLIRAQVADCFRADLAYDLPGVRSLLADIDRRLPARDPLERLPRALGQLRRQRSPRTVRARHVLALDRSIQA